MTPGASAASPNGHSTTLPPRRRARRLWRAFWTLVASFTAVVLLLALLVREVSWFGPWLANSLRAVFGTDAVTRLEELAASAQDWEKRLVRSEQSPRSLDEVRSADLPEPASVAAPEASVAPRFEPPNVGAMKPAVAAKGDGVWRPVVDPARPDATPLLFETLLHPDNRRPWTEVFVVAADISALQLYAVAGTVEPEATTREGMLLKRGGLIPDEHASALITAFNGGFMTKHGRHGMHVDGVTLVSPQPQLCTLVGFDDGRLLIGTWKALADEVARAASERNLRFWRQAAPCMYELGRLNPLLRDDDTRNWGATVDGNAVIRRSAVGLNSERSILFIAVSNDTSAHALAAAMHHAGASDVAQLDVNWSYPKILVFPVDRDGRRYARSLFKGFLFRENDYVRRPSQRDFFYLVRRGPAP